MADYATVDNIKEYLVIDDNKSDSVLTRLITAVSASIDAYLSRVIASAAYTETFTGPQDSCIGSTVWFFPEFPVTSVTSVTIEGTAIAQSVGTGAGWNLVDGTLQLIGYRFSSVPGANVVVYVAGFSPTPPAIEHVCMELVAMRYRERTRLGITSESDGRGMNRSYSFDMPPWCEKILNQYVNTVPA